MKRRALLWLVLAVGRVTILGPRLVSAQDVAVLQGAFVHDSTAGDDVKQAIAVATAELGFLHRRFARGHLEREHRPYRSVTIEQRGDTVSIAMDGGEPVRALAGGDPVEWTRADGHRIRVSIVREDGRIRQTFQADDGERENLFRPDPNGGDMRIAVTAHMDRLSQPVRYELVYRRAP